MASLLCYSTLSLAIAALSQSAMVLTTRGFAVSSTTCTSNPNILNNETHSDAAVKANKYNKDPQTLQKEHAQSVNDGSSSSKVTSTPNNAPTQSEDAIHVEKHSKSLEQLQKEMAGKIANNH